MRVIVVGAGPGGAAAALELARAGADVRLVEKSTWPREKTCGDGISPLAVREGERLGLRFEGALRLHGALVSTPRGTAFRGAWPAATPWGTIVERRVFDAALVDAAVAAGAHFAPATAVREVRSTADGIVATLRADDADRELRADVALVAEGATGGIAASLGFAPFRSRLVAVRGYAETARPLAPEYGLFYDRPLSPGYGWVFPVDRNRANVGILLDERALARGGGDLRALLARWLAESRFARELLGERPRIGGVRGGVIPSGRKRRTAPGVFLIGDAAGVADPFTAEGIFQALHSGRLAARALAESADADAARARYERELAVFDRNDQAARALRATFDLAIEPYARRARTRPRLADRLNTGAFFLKTSFAGFIWGLARAW
jgi:geranylgeranyl reductase family protein